ncbi:MAG: hypothetical protein GF349_03175 [Candidatus Magasanikbacteria bacterium]|nr:hypothetical protein [Candidatus Magasanikbacteria bacterium]
MNYIKDNKKESRNESDLNRAVTLEVLLEYTDQFLIPKISDLIDDRFEQIDKRFDMVDDRFEQIDKRFYTQEHDLKSYIDDKLADQTSEIFKRLDRSQKREKEFKKKQIELFKQYEIGSKEDIVFLENLISNKKKN